MRVIQIALITHFEVLNPPSATTTYHTITPTRPGVTGCLVINHPTKAIKGRMKRDGLTVRGAACAAGDRFRFAVRLYIGITKRERAKQAAV